MNYYSITFANTSVSNPKISLIATIQFFSDASNCFTTAPTGSPPVRPDCK